MVRKAKAPWNPGSRYLEEKWNDEQFQSHRARIDAVGGAVPKAEKVKRSIEAMAAPATANLFCQRGSTAPPKIVAKSKSPAAKSRQAQIDHDNLKMIKKIVSLQTRKPLHGGDKDSHRRSTTQLRPSTSRASLSSETIEVRAEKPQAHPCHPLPDVPSAASHALYTRQSATMKNNFAEINTPTVRHSPAAARYRTQIKIMDENRKLLQRILATKTCFSRTSWQQQEKERLKLLANISRHSYTKPPRMVRSASTSQTELNPTDLSVSSSTLQHVMQHGTLPPGLPRPRPRSATVRKQTGGIISARGLASFSWPLTSRRKVGCDILTTGFTNLSMEDEELLHSEDLLDG